MGESGRLLEELVPQEERGFDQYSIHRYIFSPDPGNHFSFNVDGIDVLLAELTCRKPHAPPSPPLLSPPPPSPPAPFKFSNGLRSFSSRAAVGVLCFLFLLRVLMCLWQSSSGRALRRSCFGGYGQTRTVISAAEDSSSNGGRTDGCWAVLIVVGGTRGVDAAGASFDGFSLASAALSVPDIGRLGGDGDGGGGGAPSRARRRFGHPLKL